MFFIAFLGSLAVAKTVHPELIGNPYAQKYKSGEWIYARNI
jgi:hypothetical protein